MAANCYVQVIEVQRRVDSVSTSWTATETTTMERIIEAVSRAIDAYCNRQFYKTTTSTARYFTAEDGAYLEVPDLVSVTTLVTDEDGDRTYETTWAATDYDLWPYNASEVYRPYTELRVTPQGTNSFPTLPKGVKITGQWGWPAIPPEIVEATVLESLRTWQHAQAPSGVSADQELGSWIVAPQLHPKTRMLIAPFVRGIASGSF